MGRASSNNIYSMALNISSLKQSLKRWSCRREFLHVGTSRLSHRTSWELHGLSFPTAVHPDSDGKDLSIRFSKAIPTEYGRTMMGIPYPGKSYSF